MFWDDEPKNLSKNDVRYFGSLTELVTHVRNLPYRQEYYDEGNDWYGGSWDDTYRLTESGWQEGAREASEMAIRIADRAVQSTASALKTEVVYDVVGAAYDPGAYMSGVPECWLGFKPHEEKSGVRFVANVAVSCGVTAEIFKRRGIALAALALAMNAQGHAVTIDVVSAIKPRDRTDTYETVQFRVADAMSGSPLDIDRVVYGLAHPTVFRRICAAVTNGFRGKTGDTRWGSSRVPFSDEDIPNLGELDLFLGVGHIDEVRKWNDGGEEWVLREYEKRTSA